MFKKYKIGFDIWGLVLFLIIMIPNLIWFAVPAPNDILRTESKTEIIDTIASVFQVIMVGSLCVIINKEREKIRLSPLIICAIVCCLIYFSCWVLYYNEIVNAAVIILLEIPPCAAFLFFALDRKNYIAVTPIIIFAACHLTFGIVNFIL